MDHLIYRCPGMQEARDRAGPKAKAAWELRDQEVYPNLPCFWERGLVPRDLFWPTPHPEGLKLLEGGTQGHLPHAGTVWTDGSGLYPKDHRLRTCTWSVVTPGMGWKAGTLPGQQQTVYRAELFAVLQAIESTWGDIELVSDCKGVVNK